MTSISTAVTSDRVSRVIGYKLLKGVYNLDSPNLPQRIAILAEANHTNQSGLTVNPVEVTTAKQVGDLFGYGSPIHQIMRILKPTNSDGVGGIPIVVYPQLEAAGATATIIKASAVVATSATSNAKHYLVINGRDNIDGTYYEIDIAQGDVRLGILTKAMNAVNALLSSPFVATLDTTTQGSELLVLTSKHYGITSAEYNISWETNGNAAGVTYATTATTTGTGATSLTNSLAVWGTAWNTIVINSYGQAAFDTLEAFNGMPDPVSPTGQWGALKFKPFISIWGSTLSSATSLIAITNANSRLTNCTHALAPAPNSLGISYEAAANMAYLFALNSQNTPHLDVNGQAYPDMPASTTGIGDFAIYDNRDNLVKNGSSTVDMSSGKYIVEDFVTTYHPTGENPPQYRYCRNLMIDFNVRYGYYLLEIVNVLDHAIVPSGQIISVQNTIRPVEWKQILNSYALDMASRALISDASFMQKSIVVAGDGTNPDRLNTFFRYKRTGVARISSTDAEAGFNFNVN